MVHHVLLEEVLLGSLAQQHTPGVRVLGRPVGAAHHLQDIGDGVVVVGVQLAVVVLRVHDDDQVGLDGEGPGQGPGRHHHLDGSGVEETLYQSLVPGAEALVHVGHALAQGLAQSLVGDLIQERCDILIENI